MFSLEVDHLAGMHLNCQRWIERFAARCFIVAALPPIFRHRATERSIHLAQPFFSSSHAFDRREVGTAGMARPAAA